MSPRPTPPPTQTLRALARRAIIAAERREQEAAQLRATAAAFEQQWEDYLAAQKRAEVA